VIAIALFAVAGVLYVLASHRRETAIPPEGTQRSDRVTNLLTLTAIGVAMAAILLSSVQMVLAVTT
jgi:hypothetical protein